MSENPQGPSLEEISAMMNDTLRCQWRNVVSFLFGQCVDGQTYPGNVVRDAMWIMWSLARVAAQEQVLEEIHAIVQELYNERKEEPKVAAEREPPQAPQRSRFSFSFHRDGPESGTE